MGVRERNEQLAVCVGRSRWGGLKQGDELAKGRPVAALSPTAGGCPIISVIRTHASSSHCSSSRVSTGVPCECFCYKLVYPIIIGGEFGHARSVDAREARVDNPPN